MICLFKPTCFCAAGFHSGHFQCCWGLEGEFVHSCAFVLKMSSSCFFGLCTAGASSFLCRSCRSIVLCFSMFCDEVLTPQPATKFCEEEERCQECQGRGDSEGKKRKAQNGNGISGIHPNPFSIAVQHLCLLLSHIFSNVHHLAK
jgi:hypothetical protein